MHVLLNDRRHLKVVRDHRPVLHRVQVFLVDLDVVGTEDVTKLDGVGELGPDGPLALQMLSDDVHTRRELDEGPGILP